MKKLKRGTSLILTTLLTAALAACGSSNTSGNVSNSSGNSGSKTITITETDYYTADPGNTAINNLIQKFEQSHPNIKIQRNTVPGTSLLSKALQEATSHSLPDLLMLDNPWLQSFASTGALTSLDTLGKLDTSQYFKGPLSTVTYKGKIYGLPIGNNDLVLFYNKKMLQAAHIDPPKTWDDLVQDAKALSHGNTYGIAFCAANTEESTWQFEPFLWSNNGHLRKADSPQAIEALNLWTNLVKSGSASKAVLNWTQADVETQFEQGRAAMEINGPWNLPALKKAGIDYGIATIPVPKSGMKPVLPLGGEVFTIPQSSPEKEKAAWTFLQWMQQPSNLIVADEAFNYLPAYIPATDQLVKDKPEMAVFENELSTGRARTTYLGANYPKASQAVMTAIQSSITGTMSPSDALKQAQGTISQLGN